MSCRQRPEHHVEAVAQVARAAARQQREGRAHRQNVAAEPRDHRIEMPGTRARARILQHRPVRPAAGIHVQEIVHGVRAHRSKRAAQQVARGQQAMVVGIAIGGQRYDLLRARIHHHLAVVARSRADRIGGHDVVDHSVATLGYPVAQAGGAVGIERLAPQAEMVRGDLRQSATEGVAGDCDLWLLIAQFSLPSS